MFSLCQGYIIDIINEVRGHFVFKGNPKTHVISCYIMLYHVISCYIMLFSDKCQW